MKYFDLVVQTFKYRKSTNANKDSLKVTLSLRVRFPLVRRGRSDNSETRTADCWAHTERITAAE